MSLRNKFCEAILLSCVLVAWVCGDEPNDTEAARPGRAGVLLFRSGRAMEGGVSETETHYVVERSAGRVTIPKADIEYVGNDLRDVYRYKLEHVNPRDPEEHLRLAQWCLVVNLREQAVEVLERALELAPNSLRIARMLDGVRHLPALKESTIPVPGSDQERSAALRRSENPPVPKTIPPNLVSNFTLQIQPMLTRSCSTAGCHDASHEGSLVLQRTSRPVQKITQQNLRAVLSQLRFDEPERSPLLAQAARAHGRAKTPPLALGASDPAFVRLADWVRQLADTQASPGSKDGSGESDASAGSVVQAEPRAMPQSETARLEPLEPENSSEAALSQAVAAWQESARDPRVFSNQPLVPTPSRIRAGMIQGPSPSKAPEPITNAAVSSSQERAVQDSGAGQVPPARPNAPHSPNSASTPKKSPEAGSAKSTDRFQPVDPFDPEIFNRQYAPR